MLARQVEDEITAQLAPHGFVRRDLPAITERWSTSEGGSHATKKPRTAKLIKSINQETEIFLFPGAVHADGRVRVNPVIAIENLRIRARMEATNEPWRNTHSVGHAYLGNLAGWNRLYLVDPAQIMGIARQVADSTVQALPLLQAYDTLSKVRDLFIAEINKTSPRLLAVLFAAEKLSLSIDN